MGLELLLEPAAVTPFHVEDFLLGVLLQPCDVSFLRRWERSVHHSLIWRRRRRNVGQIRARSQKAVDVRGEGEKVGNVEASESV